jgi:hypothetical protein
MENNISKILLQTMRYSGYLLFFLVLAQFISGLGITEGLFDRYVAHEIHADILPLPILLAFIVHSVLNFRLLLVRIRNRAKTPK